jgi:hypothetical protein
MKTATFAENPPENITINAPVFFMEREVTPITGPSNAYFPPEIHYFLLHKKTGALVILCT